MVTELRNAFYPETKSILLQRYNASLERQFRHSINDKNNWELDQPLAGNPYIEPKTVYYFSLCQSADGS